MWGSSCPGIGKKGFGKRKEGAHMIEGGLSQKKEAQHRVGNLSKRRKRGILLLSAQQRG